LTVGRVNRMMRRRKERVAVASCENQKKNAAACPCTYTSCDKRGACCACVAYHRANDELPGCFFPPDAERTYDRSVAHFVRVMQRDR